MSRPEHWTDPAHKLFEHQVAFTGPPRDFDAAPSDFLRLAPRTVGVHGRLLHAPEYAHQLDQRADNFHLLEEVVYCMSNSGADVVGQVGTNWVHAGGRNVGDITDFVRSMEETYGIPLHMAGMTLVEACRHFGYERIALNSVYFWPDWRDGVARFLRSADIDVVWFGNFVDQGLSDDQRWVNDQYWIFPESWALESCRRTLEAAPDVDAILINGMSNYRGDDGVPRRLVEHAAAIEHELGTPILAADITLYWRILSTLGVAPVGNHGSVLASLQESQ